MKNSLLLIFVSVLFTGAINAQVIFSGESPASIQGSYSLEYTEPPNWGSPDLMDPNNSVLDTLVQFYDATAEDSLGCGAAVNSADVTGQIAMIYRGACEFGTKALNAQNAGAIACVIVNNVPGGPIPMGAGADGANVTIPVVMISDVDGATLKAAMLNGTVEVFIGNKAGYYLNDLGTTGDRILRAKSSITPSLIAQDASEFNFQVGAWVINYGSQNQTNVTLGATVDFGGTLVYNESATPVDIVSGDSAFFALPDFSLATYTEGTYALNYIITSDSVDDYTADNEISSDFAINESLYSYASFDNATYLPNSSGGVRPGGQVTSYQRCIHFRDPNASRIAATGIIFSSLKGADATDPSLDGEPVNITIQEYNDQFTDVNDPGFQNPIVSINEIAFAEYNYPADLPGEAVKALFNAPVTLQDNQRYLFCVQTFNGDLFFGSDPNMNYEWNFQTYLQPLFPVQGTDWNPVGFGSESVPALSVEFVDAAQVNLQEEKLGIEMKAYPSPASSILNVDFNGYEVNSIEMVNLTGQRVAQESVNTGADSASLNVNGLENGVYIVKVNLTNGMTETMQVVVNH